MKISTKALKIAALGVSAATMMVATQEASAHASILNTVNSGTAIGSTSFSRIGVNHACNGTSPVTPVVAQSAVIPTINPIISSNDPVSSPAVAAVGTSGQPGFVAAKAAGSYYTILPNTAAVSDYLVTTLAGTTPVTTLANRFQLVQSKNVFTSSIEQRNSTGTDVIGWVSTKGSLQINEHGEVPFRFSNVFFKPDSCLRSVIVQLAVADICKTNSLPLDPTKLSTVQGVNLWIDSTNGGSTHFPASSIEAGAGTTNFTINRDPVANPYPATCAAAPVVTKVAGTADAQQIATAGTPTAGSTPLFDVKIQPSAADLEQLQFPGWGGTVSGNSFQ